MPTTYSIPEIPEWSALPLQNLVQLSGFAGYGNLQIEITTLNGNALSQVALVSNLLTTQLTSQVSTINTTIQSLSSNTAYNISNLFLYVNQVQSNLYSNIQTTSNTLTTSIQSLSSNTASQFNNVYLYIGNVSSTLSSQISIAQSNISSLGASVSNINLAIGNITSTSTLQYSNIYNALNSVSSQVSTLSSNTASQFNNVYITLGNLQNQISNIHLSSNVSLANVLFYSNLNTIDVRQLSNTSNIIYSGSNISALTNNSGYITANSSPTFNNITIYGVANTQILNATTDIASPMIYSTDIDVQNSIVIGTFPNCIVLSVVAGRDGKVNALQIAQDALGGVSMLMDGLGIASGVLGSLKGLTDGTGAPAEDLEEQLEEDTNSGNVTLAVEWASIKNAPIGYTGTTVKKCAIQSDLYTGGSLYYDSSIVDITENGYGSVQFNSTSSGLKMIDGQSQTAYFTDVKASGNVKTDDIRPYTSGTPLYIYADINAQGNISSQLYITATKDISTSANISSNYLVATNNITSNTINTTGFVGSRVKFFQDVEFVGNVRCDTNEAVYGALTANSVYVNYDTTVGGNIQCNNLFFGGNVYYNSSIVQFSQWSGNTKQISYGGNVLVSGNIIASNYFINSSNIQQYILNTVGNNYWVGNTNSISTTANASVNNLAVNNLKASGNGTIYCYSNIVLISSSLIIDPADLIVELDAVVWGNLTVLTDVVCNNYIVGNTSLYNYIIQTVGNTQISVSNITNIYSNTINTNVIYSSNISSNSLSVNNITIAGNTLNTYIQNITGNTALLVSNVYLQSNYVNNVYIQNNFVGNNFNYASNAYIQNQYVSKTQGNAWYLSGSGYISNNSSYNISCGAVSGTTGTFSSTISGNLCSLASNGGAGIPATGVLGGAGDRLVLYPGGSGVYPYSLGISGGTLWYSSPGLQTWYCAGGTSVMTMSSTGISVSGSVSCGNLSAASPITPSGQGSYVSWNRSGATVGNGQNSYLNQLGLGTGGFEWVCYNNSNALSSVPMYLYPNGNLVVDKLTANTCSLPYATGFNGKLSTCNNDAGFLTSASSTPGINSVGNVAINASSPGITLDVNGKWGTTSTTGVAVPSVGTSGGSGDKMILYPGSGSTYPYSLGINGGTLWYSIPSGGVHSWYINGTSYMSLATTGLTFSYVYNSWITSSDGKNRVYYASSGRSYYASGDGTHEWRIDSTGATTGMFLNSTGLSIGSGTSPSYPLDVSGTGRIQGGMYVGSLGVSGQTAGTFTVGCSTTGVQIVMETNYLTNAGVIECFNAGNTVKLPIILNAYGGNVGIGSSSTPSYPLDVSGAMRITGNFNMATTGTPTIFGVGNDIQFSSAGITLSSVGILYLTTVNGIVGTGVSAWSGAMTVGSGTTQTTYPLKVVGNTFTSGCFVGSIAPSGLVNYCPNSLTLYGTSSSITGGAHIQGFTNADSYSTYQLLNWTHDNMCLGFDSQFNGSNWVSCYSSAPSYQIYKTGGCLNFNYAPTTSASSTITNTTTMCINTNKIGILNTSPAYNLDVSGNCRITNGFTSSAFSGVGITTPAYWLDVQGTSISTAIFNCGYASPYSVFTVRGSAVGILNAVPSYNLDVNGNMRVVNCIYAQGGDSVATGTPYGYLGTGGAGVYSGGSSSQATSISASNRVRAGEFDAYSDERIKKDIQDRDGRADLDTLMKVRMRSFKHIDPKKSGDDDNIGVIAQELEGITELNGVVKNFPDFIPNTFEKRDCICSGENINIVGTSVGQDGDEIQFYYVDADGKEMPKTGAVFNGGYSLKINETLEVAEIFVYGKKIDDFKSVAYNSLHNLNISATQELYKIIQKQNDRIDDLERKLEQITKYSYRAGVI